MSLTSLRLATAVLSTSKDPMSPAGKQVTVEELRAAFSQLGARLTPDERAFVERTAARSDLTPEAKAEAQKWLRKAVARSGTSEAVSPREAVPRLVDAFGDEASLRGRTFTRAEAKVVIDALAERPTPETARAMAELREEVKYLGADAERGVAGLVENWFGTRPAPTAFTRAFDAFRRQWGSAPTPGVSMRHFEAVSLEGTSLKPADVAAALGSRREPTIVESVADYIASAAHEQSDAKVARLQALRAFLDQELPGARVFHTDAGVYALALQQGNVVGVCLT
ncbi:MAG: hypothetical protein SFW67_34725 [Myxococcaceae bacterium]|nr:hypothetical protein [Myxococcaceae bacterium]